MWVFRAETPAAELQVPMPQHQALPSRTSFPIRTRFVRGF